MYSDGLNNIWTSLMTSSLNLEVIRTAQQPKAKQGTLYPCKMGTSKLEWSRSPQTFLVCFTRCHLHGLFQFWLENGILQYARWRQKQDWAASVMQHCTGRAVTRLLPIESRVIQKPCVVATSVTCCLCGFWSFLGKCFCITEVQWVMDKTRDFFDDGGGFQPWSWGKDRE